MSVPADEMRAFIDEVREIAPLTVESTPEGGIASVKIGATEKLVEVANSAESHGLLLTYDGSSVIAIPVPVNSLPDEEVDLA